MSRAAPDGGQLERFALLGGLSPAALARIAAHAAPCRLREGDTLFFKNDPGDFLALVVDGWIYKILYGPEGQELIVGAIGPGEVVDEAVLLDGQRRSFTAVAYAAASVLKLPRRHFPLLLTEPAVLERAYATLCGSLRQAIDNLETMCLHRLEARLARYLLMQVPRQEGHGQRAVEIVLPPTQSILAAMVNVSRSRLNAQLQQWDRSGLVSRRRNLLRIHDLDAFRVRAYLVDAHEPGRGHRMPAWPRPAAAPGAARPFPAHDARGA